MEDVRREHVALGATPAVARRGLLARAGELPATAWLAGFVAVSAAIRFALALWIPAPWIFADELKYSELAKSFAASGHFAVRDVPGLGTGPLYPVLISPAYALFESVPHAYVAIKLINSVVMSLAAIPVYFLARRLLTTSWSLVAAALSLAVPSMAFTGMVMTENFFYPLCLTAVLAMVAALERPTVPRQLAALALIAVALLTRPQAVALVPALLCAIVLVAVGDSRHPRELLRGAARFAPTFGLLVIGIAAVAVREAVAGRSFWASFGDAQNIWREDFSAGAVARWFLYHVAELDLFSGVLPFAAFLVLISFVFVKRERSARIVAAVFVSVTFWLVLTSAAFLSSIERYDTHTVAHVSDRYTFYAVPLFVIALLAWLTGAVRRSARGTALAALAALVLPMLLPIGRLITNQAVADSLGLLPWATMRGGTIAPVANAHVKVALAAAALGAAFFLLRPPRLGRLVPVLVPLLVLLYFVSGLSAAELRMHAAAAGPSGAVGSNRDWIDEAIGPKSEAVVFWPARRAPHLVWENEFFNRSVGTIYYTRTPSWAGLPEQHVTVRKDGRLFVDDSRRPVRARYLLADPSVVPLTGHLVAVDQTSGMRLFAVGSGRGLATVRIAPH